MKRFFTMLTVTLLLSATTIPARAGSLEELQKQVDELNSQMKDYYDVWLIAETFEFNGQSLQKAIETTFKKRETALPVKRPISLSMDFADANNSRWGTFLGKMGLDSTKRNDFPSIVEEVWRFVEYPLQCSVNRTKSTRNWVPKKGWN